MADVQAPRDKRSPWQCRAIDTIGPACGTASTNREGAGEISFSVCGGSRRILCLSARRTRTGHSRRRHARRLCGDGDGRSDRRSGWRSCWRRHWRRRWLARHLSGRAAVAGVSSPELSPAFLSLLPSQTHDRLKRLYGGRAALSSPYGLGPPILWDCPWADNWGIRPLLIHPPRGNAPDTWEYKPQVATVYKLQCLWIAS